MQMPANDSDATSSLPPSVTRLVGVPGPTVTMWGITKKKRVDGRYERMTYGDGNGGRVRTWPLAELSAEVIRERWGAGEYRVCWFEGQSTKGCGLEFGIEEEEAPPPPRAAAAPPMPAERSGKGLASFGQLGEALELVSILDARANDSLVRTLQVAAAIGQRPSGLDAETLKAIFDRQDKLIEQLQANHAEQMRALTAKRAADEDEDEEEEDEGDESDGPKVGSVAAAAVPFIKGKQSLKSAFINYATENPADVFAVIKSIPEVMSQVSQMMKMPEPAPAPRPQPQQPVALPEAKPRQVRAVPKPGLNQLFETPAPASVAPPAPAPAPLPVPSTESAAQ